MRWAAARSISRGLPAPVIDGAAVRVDTGQAAEQRRYIFATASPSITALADTIDRGAILLKACVPLPDLLALLPAGWRAQPQACLMFCDGPMTAARPLPPDYTLDLETEGQVTIARVLINETIAASGRAVHHAGLAVYDQIVTHPAHRRRGLGTVVMTGLEHAVAGSERQVLTATSDGHALYATLGWRTGAAWSTAEFARAEP